MSHLSFCNNISTLCTNYNLIYRDCRIFNSMFSNCPSVSDITLSYTKQFKVVNITLSYRKQVKVVNITLSYRKQFKVVNITLSYTKQFKVVNITLSYRKQYKEVNISFAVLLRRSGFNLFRTGYTALVVIPKTLKW